MIYRLGVDVGGTFTNLLPINEDTGDTFRAKIPTIPANQASAVLDGIERVCAIAEIKPSALTELMHGTTATTNAVLEGKGRARRAGHHRRLSPDSSGGALLRARRSCGMDNLAKARAARGAR
jgi:N-methylhydantoinase A/oxoprolinase/acetone carboxylase beta subunit